MKRTLACLMALFLAVTTVLPSQASGMGTADSHTEASALSDSGTKRKRRVCRKRQRRIRRSR